MPLLFHTEGELTTDTYLCRRRQNTYSTRLLTFVIISPNLPLTLGAANVEAC
jgi:hypothetical protein